MTQQPCQEGHPETRNNSTGENDATTIDKNTGAAATIQKNAIKRERERRTRRRKEMGEIATATANRIQNEQSGERERESRRKGAGETQLAFRHRTRKHDACCVDSLPNVVYVNTPRNLSDEFGSQTLVAQRLVNTQEVDFYHILAPANLAGYACKKIHAFLNHQQDTNA